ncbi:hypothetical protein [Bradyrhizobium sp. CCBAU 11434]|uniref:hypothetical protein n=1 Tax=Bradyrhizobium sp. CCBAU 11434 TaxID=1630885 RepID=UPI0023062083|nr:hypothetical protein [Bradyrhizobium sp. CCBAU 11434]
MTLDWIDGCVAAIKLGFLHEITPMSFLRRGGVRLKPKLTLKSFSERLGLRAPASDGNTSDRDGADHAVLAHRVVCAMRRGDDKKTPERQD